MGKDLFWLVKRRRLRDGPDAARDDRESQDNSNGFIHIADFENPPRPYSDMHIFL